VSLREVRVSGRAGSFVHSKLYNMCIYYETICLSRESLASTVCGSGADICARSLLCRRERESRRERASERRKESCARVHKRTRIRK
jgi:hypothetical protein